MKTVIIVLGTYTENTWENEAKCDILMVTDNPVKAENLVDEYINMPNCGEYDSVYLEYHTLE